MSHAKANHISNTRQDAVMFQCSAGHLTISLVINPVRASEFAARLPEAVCHRYEDSRAVEASLNMYFDTFLSSTPSLIGRWRCESNGKNLITNSCIPVYACVRRICWNRRTGHMTGRSKKAEQEAYV